MVTDDDPVEQDFLLVFSELLKKHPGNSIYAGFIRSGKSTDAIEIISKDDFIIEVLDPIKTPRLLWSSCVMEKESVMEVGKIPEYGSPHLADHALIAMVGSIKGGVVINKMFSTLTSHDSNFSKFNFNYYKIGCKGFFDTLNTYSKNNRNYEKQKKVILKHIENWFISTFFTLKKYYTKNLDDNEKLTELNEYAEEVLCFSFMRGVRVKFLLKNIIFHLKEKFNLLK
jgi:hypothetical protein